MFNQYGKYGLQRQGQSPDGDTMQDRAQGVPLQNGQETEAPGQDMNPQAQGQMNPQAMQRPTMQQGFQQPQAQPQPMQQAAAPQQPQAMPRSRFDFQATRQQPTRFMDRQGPRFGASWQ
jgi:hypothetical protein